MQLSFEDQMARIEKHANYLEKKLLPQSFNAALNKSGTFLSNQAIGSGASKLGITRKILKERVKIQRSTWKNMQFKASQSYKTITYMSLGKAVQTRYGVRVGKRRVLNGFIAPTPEGTMQVFYRVGRTSDKMPTKKGRYKGRMNSRTGGPLKRQKVEVKRLYIGKVLRPEWERYFGSKLAEERFFNDFKADLRWRYARAKV